MSKIKMFNSSDFKLFSLKYNKKEILKHPNSS